MGKHAYAPCNNCLRNPATWPPDQQQQIPPCPLMPTDPSVRIATCKLHTKKNKNGDRNGLL